MKNGSPNHDIEQAYSTDQQIHVKIHIQCCSNFQVVCILLVFGHKLNKSMRDGFIYKILCHQSKIVVWHTFLYKVVCIYTGVF